MWLPAFVVYSKPSTVTPPVGSVHVASSLSSFAPPLTVATFAVIAGSSVRASRVADAAEFPTFPSYFIRTWNSYNVAPVSEPTATLVSLCTKLSESAVESATSVQLAVHAVWDAGFTR